LAKVPENGLCRSVEHKEVTAGRVSPATCPRSWSPRCFCANRSTRAPAVPPLGGK
jgi:hypothetical protein